MIKFGPSGLGGVKDAISTLEKYKSLGFEACEIAFTYGVYIKHKEDAIKIGEAAKKLGIKLSIHAHYWINLNSEDEEKIAKSKERILQCLETGTWLGAYRVIFHPGYYSKGSREESYEVIREGIMEIQKIRKEKKYTPELAPEITGKPSVFGSIDEISRLVKDTKCSFCIDFAHVLARYDSYKFDEVSEAFKDSKEWHIHFSGIEYSSKGEKKHKTTEEKEIKKLLENLPKNKDIVIINEAPDPVGDSVKALEIYRK